MGKDTELKNGQSTNTDPNAGEDTKKKGSTSSEDLEDDDELEEGEDKKPEKTFTQAQLNKILAKDRKANKAAFLKELGLDKVDSKEVDKIVKYLESSKSGEEKANDKVSELERELAETKAKNLELEVKGAILTKGITAKYADVAAMLIKQKMSEEDSDDTDTILDELKEEYPEWFSDAENKGDNKKKIGTGKQVSGSANKKGGGSSSMAERLVEQRKAELSTQKTEGKKPWSF